MIGGISFGLASMVASMVTAAEVPLQAGEGKPFNLQLAGLYIIPDQSAPTSQVRTAKPDDVLLEAPLAYKHVAKVRHTRELDVGDVKLSVDPRTILRRATSIAADERFASVARIYCSPSLVISREIRRPPNEGSRGSRFDENSRYCLVDQDADGSFDQVFINSAKWEIDQRLFEVASIEYETNEILPIQNGKVRIQYYRFSRVRAPALFMQSNLANSHFQTASVFMGTSQTKTRDFEAQQSVKAAAYPKTITFGDAKITLLSYNSSNHLLSYRIDRGFELSPAKIVIEFPAYSFITGAGSNSIFTFE